MIARYKQVIPKVLIKTCARIHKFNLFMNDI